MRAGAFSKSAHPRVCGGTFSKSAHPHDDAEHGRLAKPTAHGGVYIVDGHGRPEQHAGGEELNFSCRPPGRSPHPPLDFFSLWAGRKRLEPTK